MDAAFFDTPIERRGTASFKWDMYGEDVLPLWVADMDFASPPPVVEALAARAAHGVFGYALTPDSLVEAIVEHCERRYGWRVERGVDRLAAGRRARAQPRLRRRSPPPARAS